MLSVAAALCCTAAHAGPVLERIKNTGRFLIGYRDASMPFSYLDENKKPMGYSIDLCVGMADGIKKKLGLSKLTIEYVLLTHATRNQALVEGQADIECSSTANNAERRKKMAFSIPHYISGTLYAVRADSGITDLAHFEGKRLASTVGSLNLSAVERANSDRLLHIKVVTAQTHSDVFNLLVKGEADGAALDDVKLYTYIAALPDPSKYKVVGKFLTIDAMGLMMNKADPEFKQLVDGELRRMIYSREAHALYDRWFMQPIPPKNRPLNVPMNHLIKDFWKFPSDFVPN